MLRRWLLVAVTLLLRAGRARARCAERRGQAGEEEPAAARVPLLLEPADYAQRNGVRVVRRLARLPARRRRPAGPRPVPPPWRSARAAAGARSRRAAGGDSGSSTSPTNVQEAGVDEPDRVKTADGRVFIVTGGKLRIVDATVDAAATARLARPPRLQQRPARCAATRARDRPARIRRDGPVGVAAQVGSRCRRRSGSSRTRLIEVDVADPAAPRVLRTLRRRGRLRQRRLTGDTARVVVATEPRGLNMPDDAGSTARRGPARAGGARCGGRGRAAWLPAAVLRERRTGRRQRRALVRCRQVRRTQAFTGLGTLTVLTIDMSGNRPALPAVDADSLMTERRDRLRVAGPAVRRLRALARLGSDAPRGARLGRDRAARVRHHEAVRDLLRRQRRGARLPAQPVVAVRAPGRAAGGDDVDAAVGLRARERERGADAGGARGAAGGDRAGRRPRQRRADLRGALHGRQGLRRHVPADRPAATRSTCPTRGRRAWSAS